MSIIVNVRVGEELADTVPLRDEIDSAPWARLSSNSFTVVETTNYRKLPSLEDEWDGTKFRTLSGRDTAAGFMYFSFVIDGKVVLTHGLRPEVQGALIAAYRSNPTFEVVDDPKV